MPNALAAIHAALTAIMAWLGIVLAHSQDAFAHSQNFQFLQQLEPACVWEAIFWGLTTTGVAGLISRARLVKIMSALCLATGHGVIAASFLIARPINTGNGVYAIVALLGYYLALRLCVDRA